MHAALKVKHRTPWSTLSVGANVQTAPNADVVVVEADDIAAAIVEDEAETLTGDLDATRDHRTQHATRQEDWVADM